jgi:hypothetical protein
MGDAKQPQATQAMTFDLATLRAKHRNPRKISDADKAALAKSIAEFSKMLALRPIVYDPVTMEVLGGNQRLVALKEAGYKEVPDSWVRSASDLTEEEKRRFVVVDNTQAGEWDTELLLADYTVEELQDWGLDLPEFDANELEPQGEGSGEAKGTLASRFLIPPFSVLNAREGWWQDRKRYWLAMGIKSEEGREGLADTSATPMDYFNGGKTIADQGGSVFDPTLCEVLYTWFSPPGGTVLDPFAGGSVRGIVAAKLGRQYIGGELRPEQVAANRVQAADICGADEVMPAWVEGDSRNIDKACAGVQADFVFSCPPYADLEVYSDDPADLSTLGYADFVAAYREIIAKACTLLKPNRFACFVVGEVRDKKGNYYDFVGDTVQAFRDAGLHFYNEAILVTAVGSLPIRAGKQFASGRKLGKTHQNILVFVKGDGKKAATDCGEVEVYLPEEMETDTAV